MLAHRQPIAYVAAMAEQGQPQSYAPSAQDIETLALAALSRMPDPFADYLAGVVLFIEEFAAPATLRALGVTNAFDLTGLYNGRPVGQEAQTGDMPPSIHLYRRPLLEEWVETGVALEALIAHVVVHEVGHHFGLSDADMHGLEDLVSEDLAGE
jgi:predicted Zn-dependent protease with MMP-like domain